MTKREKTLGLGLLLILITMAHVYAVMKIKEHKSKQDAELAELKTTLKTYSMMGQTVSLIKNEVDWLNQYMPPVVSFPIAQTDLQNFLMSSSRSIGFTPYAQKLIAPKDSNISSTNRIYQSVKIQISARATEKQIYEWLVKVHQPQKMRTLSYLKLSPPINDSNLINCQIIAEQYIIIK